MKSSDQPLAVGIIANASAGASDQLREDVGALRQLGIEVDVRVAWEGNQTAGLVQHHLDNGRELIIAAGGDGTINAVAEAVWQDARDAQIGALPFGTANDFLTGLGHEDDRLLAVLRYEPHPTDIGVVASHDRVFVNVATGGFGAEVTAETNPALKSKLGGLAYVLSGIGRLAELEPFDLEVSSDGFEWSGKTLGFAVGNSCQTGGGFNVCGAASIEDALLDLCIAPAAAADSFKAYVVDGLLDSPDVIYEQGGRFEIRTSRDVQVNLDGEPISGDHFVFRVEPRAISFRR